MQKPDADENRKLGRHHSQVKMSRTPDQEKQPALRSTSAELCVTASVQAGPPGRPDSRLK